MIVLTPQQMRDADADACARIGDTALMRAAGHAIAEIAQRYRRGSRIVAFAGSGNNGGDAFSAMALLPGERALYARTAAAPSAARRDAEERARAAGVRIEPFPETIEAAYEAVLDCGLVIVGLAGTGARLPMGDPYALVLRAIAQSDAPALAIDIPPGADGATGAVIEPALRATVTVTLGAIKTGLLLAAARHNAGALWLADIGMPEESLRQAGALHALDDRGLIRLLPERGDNADKRSAGAPLILAGSEQFPGAAVLTAMGAARAGAGYVTLAAPQAATTAIRAHVIEQVVVGIDPSLPVSEAIAALADVAKRCSSLAVGPGLGLDDRTGEIVRGLVQSVDLPMVADASALFHFAKHLNMLRAKRIVLTPHEGEFARLSGKGTIKPGERISRLREFVDRTRVATLLKGAATLVYDGTTMHVNVTGTPALATAGTGDVLTGIIATLLAEGLSPVDAARAGAYWHGLAGKHAQGHRPRGVIARDVYQSLGVAIPRPPAQHSRLVRVF